MKKLQCENQNTVEQNLRHKKNLIGWLVGWFYGIPTFVGVFPYYNFVQKSFLYYNGYFILFFLYPIGENYQYDFSYFLLHSHIKETI